MDEEAKALARTGTSSGSASLASDGSAPSKPPSTPLTKDQEQQIMESAFSAAVDTSGSSTMASKGDGVVSNSTKIPGRCHRSSRNQTKEREYHINSLVGFPGHLGIDRQS